MTRRSLPTAMLLTPTLTRLLPAGLLLLALAACSPKAPEAEPIRAVRTQVMGAAAVAPALDYAAEIRARTETTLGFRVGGRLDVRAVNSGDAVRAGQVLARLDPTDLRLGLDAAAAAQRAAQTNLDLVTAEWRRYRELREQGFIGPAELDRREAAVKAARAQWEQAQAQSTAQGRQADYAALQATAAGLVTAVLAEPGQVLAAGAPVLKLAHDGPRDAVFAVPEDRAAGLRALIGRPGVATLRLWGGERRHPVTLREVAAAADPVTRTFLVKADVGALELRLGQTATVSLALADAAAGLRLPLAALVEHQGGSAVWLFDRTQGTVRLQPVQVAGAEERAVLIARGLKAGDEVVVAGTHVLTPGLKVRPWVAPGAAAAASSASAVSR